MGFAVLFDALRAVSKANSSTHPTTYFSFDDFAHRTATNLFSKPILITEAAYPLEMLYVICDQDSSMAQCNRCYQEVKVLNYLACSAEFRLDLAKPFCSVII
jgi:hypothetical protein